MEESSLNARSARSVRNAAASWCSDPSRTRSPVQTGSRRGDVEQPLRLGRAHDLHVRTCLLDRWRQHPYGLQAGKVERRCEAVELGDRFFAIAAGIFAGGQQRQLIDPLASRQQRRQADPSEHLL